MRDIKDEDPKSIWTQHTSEDGRTYYYNKVTKVSSWTKPDELKTPIEREKSLWKEYKTTEGKVYYYNTQTKATTWTKPEILNEVTSDAVKPELIQITSNSEIEKAMEATLMTLEAKPEQQTEEKKSKEPEDDEKKEEEENSYEYNLKKRQVDKFRELLQDKCNDRRINTNMSWEQCCKYIQHDPRFKILGKVSEKKQVFNAWKIQRTKDERDDRRLAIKKAKEDLENWLVNHPKMKHTLRYHKAEKYFANEEYWRAVSDTERREIFSDAKKIIEEREIEQKKALKFRNIKALGDILEGIDEIDYKTTWAQAQRILIENPNFSKDTVLQSMDKEDALVVFQKHIKMAEEEYLKEQQEKAIRTRRKERKTRESFMHFLTELHEKGTLNPSSTWASLYPAISADQRFEEMLMTTGSTALDIFKFYMEDLKNQYYQERKIVKEILNTKGHEMSESVAFDHFQEWIRGEEQGKKISTTNLKMCYNYFYDKAMEKFKENAKEAERKQKRLEMIFIELLRSISPPIGPESNWEQVNEQIKDMEQYSMMESDEQERIFAGYLKSIQEACGHQHGSGSSKKKKEKKKKKKHEYANGNGEKSHQKKSKRKRKAAEGSGDEERKKKHHRQRSPSSSVASPGEITDGN